MATIAKVRKKSHGAGVKRAEPHPPTQFGLRVAKAIFPNSIGQYVVDAASIIEREINLLFLLQVLHEYLRSCAECGGTGRYKPRVFIDDVFIRNKRERDCEHCRDIRALLSNLEGQRRNS